MKKWTMICVALAVMATGLMYWGAEFLLSREFAYLIGGAL